VRDGISIERIRLKSKRGWESPITVLVTLPIFWILAFLRILREEFSLVYCHDFDTLIVGLLVKIVRKKPVLFDSHEYYPTLLKETMPPLITKIVTAFYYVLPRKADGVIVVNDYFRTFFKRCKTVTTIMNCPDSSFVPKQIEKKSQNSLIKIFYYGILSWDRGIIELIDSVKDINDVELLIAGNGPLQQEVERKSRKYQNVYYLGWVTNKEISILVSKSDIIPILYTPKSVNNLLASPLKLLLAMAAGLPVIVYNGTVLEKIVESEKCGISIPFGDIEEIKSAILLLKENRDLYHRLSMGSLRAYNQKYNWDIMKKRLIQLIEDLV